MRRSAVLLVLVVALPLAAAAGKKTPDLVAPAEITHANAMFLDILSGTGRRQVTFKATAVGTRFFFEEPAGVTVYRFDHGRYIKEEFLHSATIDRAVSRYAQTSNGR